MEDNTGLGMRTDGNMPISVHLSVMMAAQTEPNLLKEKAGPKPTLEQISEMTVIHVTSKRWKLSSQSTWAPLLVSTAQVAFRHMTLVFARFISIVSYEKLPQRFLITKHKPCFIQGAQ